MISVKFWQISGKFFAIVLPTWSNFYELKLYKLFRFRLF